MSGPPPPRPAAMPPQQFTEEFASDRYFQKLSQKQQNGSDAQLLSSQLPSTLPGSSLSPFMLPLRDSQPHEIDDTQAQPTEQKQKKSRFGGFSRLLHHSSKTQQAQPADPPTRPVISAPIPITESFERLSVGEYVKPRRFVLGSTTFWFFRH